MSGQSKHPLSHPLAGRTILQIIPELTGGGAEQAVLDIAAALAAVGARPLVATSGGRLIGKLEAKGGIWHPFPAQSKNPLRLPMLRHRLAQLIEAEGVALVHARSRAPAWLAHGVAKRAGIPFVTTYHGIYSGRSSLKRFYNSIMAKGDVVIANSAFTAAHIRHIYPKADAKIEVIARGIDLSAFDPQNVAPERVAALRQAWGVGATDRAILLPARLTPRKGHRTAVAAAARLMAAGEAEIKFIFAGDEQGHAPYLRDLDGAIAANGLAEHVRRVGPCADMPAAMLAASVVIIPSSEPESFGRVAAEAQAMGTPVVVSRHGALPEVVLTAPDVPETAITGWQIATGDAAALAAAIRAALALNADQRAALAARARANVEERYGLALMQAQTLAVYAALVASRR